MDKGGASRYRPAMPRFALLIEYHAKENLLHLIDKARVTRGQELFEGHRISYDTDRSIITARSQPQTGEGGTTSGSGRVHVILQPKKKTTTE